MSNTRSESNNADIHGNAFGMNGGKVCILEERDQVSLGGFLEGHNGRGLKAKIGLVALE